MSCPASVDPSGATGKIHMREIEVRQGVARACYHDGFHDSMPLDSGMGAGMVPPPSGTCNIARQF